MAMLHGPHYISKVKCESLKPCKPAKLDPFITTLLWEIQLQLSMILIVWGHFRVSIVGFIVLERDCV